MKLRLIESISNKSDDLAFLLNERIARSDEHDVLEEPAAIGKPSPSIFCATPSQGGRSLGEDLFLQKITESTEDSKTQDARQEIAIS